MKELKFDELQDVNGGKKIKISPQCALATMGGAMMGATGGVAGIIVGGASAAWVSC